MRLLKKVFDSLNKLDLREDLNGNKLKMAYASRFLKLYVVNISFDFSVFG
jgi:hypothetical protein